MKAFVFYHLNHLGFFYPICLTGEFCTAFSAFKYAHADSFCLWLSALWTDMTFFTIVFNLLESIFDSFTISCTKSFCRHLKNGAAQTFERFGSRVITLQPKTHSNWGHLVPNQKGWTKLPYSPLLPNADWIWDLFLNVSLIGRCYKKVFIPSKYS